MTEANVDCGNIEMGSARLMAWAAFYTAIYQGLASTQKPSFLFYGLSIILARTEGNAASMSTELDIAHSLPSISHLSAKESCQSARPELLGARSGPCETMAKGEGNATEE